MENEILTSDNQTNDYCKKILSYQGYIIVSFIILYTISGMFYFLSEDYNYWFFGALTYLFSFIINLLPFMWLIVIPIYSYYLKRKGLLLKECFKKILINATLPIIIPLIAFGGCYLIFGLF